MCDTVIIKYDIRISCTNRTIEYILKQVITSLFFNIIECYF